MQMENCVDSVELGHGAVCGVMGFTVGTGSEEYDWSCLTLSGTVRKIDVSRIEAGTYVNSFSR